jgi:type VI secretion system protein ImpK
MRGSSVVVKVMVVGVLLAAGLAQAGCECLFCPPKEYPTIQAPPSQPMPAPTPVAVTTPTPTPVPAPTPMAPLPPLPTPPAPVPVSKPATVPDKVVAAIEDLGQKYPGLFIFNKEKGLFLFNSDITFDSGSSVIKPDAKAALTKLAEILSADTVKDRAMTIVGYTDTDRVVKAATISHLKSLNKSPDNMGLSEARAESVATVMKSGGIDAKRVTTFGKGDADPVASNATADGKSKNRRVEIYLTPMAGR